MRNKNIGVEQMNIYRDEMDMLIKQIQQLKQIRNHIRKRIEKNSVNNKTYTMQDLRIDLATLNVIKCVLSTKGKSAEEIFGIVGLLGDNLPKNASNSSKSEHDINMMSLTSYQLT